MSELELRLLVGGVKFWGKMLNSLLFTKIEIFSIILGVDMEEKIVNYILEFLLNIEECFGGF